MILGIKWAIGVSNLIPKSRSRALEMKFNSSRKVWFTRYNCPCLLTLLPVPWQSLCCVTDLFASQRTAYSQFGWLGLWIPWENFQGVFNCSSMRMLMTCKHEASAWRSKVLLCRVLLVCQQAFACHQLWTCASSNPICWGVPILVGGIFVLWKTGHEKRRGIRNSH